MDSSEIYLIKKFGKNDIRKLKKKTKKFIINYIAKKIYISILLIILIFLFIVLDNIKDLEELKKLKSPNNKQILEIKNRYKKKLTSKNIEEILPKISLDNNNIPSLDEIFNSRTLFISDANITNEYIRYIRPINEKEEEKYNKKYSEDEIKISPDIFKKRDDQYDYIQFAKLCLEEKFIYSNNISYNNEPLISVILPVYNKKDILMKSIRSIQNQSFKNIEIIIVNDCSTDDSKTFFENLLKTDPRIRIFTHLKNLGYWRSRINGILYSRGKYIFLFDTGDLYEDNYVLEDAYNLMEKYNLDSIKLLIRVINSFKNISNSYILFHANNNSNIIYEPSNIERINKYTFEGKGNIWNRIARSNIYIKGLYLLDDIVLNFYKNIYDDVWFNAITNKVSYSFLEFERIGYIYCRDDNGEGSPKLNSEAEKDTIIKEYIGFLYFAYNILPNSNKAKIIKQLKEYENNKSIVPLNCLKSNFNILNDLLILLIGDKDISNDDKMYLYKLLKKSKNKEKKCKDRYLE